MKIQTQSVHFDADVKLLEFIERKVGKLSTFHDHIINAEVYLRLDNHAKVHDKLAEIKVQVPGHTFIAKEVFPTFEQAIDESSDSIRRQLLKYKERQRG